jgi:hypothetical protein
MGAIILRSLPQLPAGTQDPAYTPRLWARLHRIAAAVMEFGVAVRTVTPILEDL